MKVKAPNRRTITYVKGVEIFFDEFYADVPDYIAKILMLKGGYSIALNNPKPLQEAKELLFIREEGLGDILLMTPIIKKIKEMKPDCNIDWLVLDHYTCLLEGNPYLRNVYTPDSLPILEVPAKYDFLGKLNKCEFDADSSVEHRTDIFASRVPGLGKIEDKHLDYFVSKEETKWAKEQKKNWGEGKVIVMVFSAGCNNRMLSSERLKGLAFNLAERYKVVLIDGTANGKDWNHSNIINLTAQLSIRESAAVISVCDCLLTPDTGMLHIAASLNISVVAYFGAMNPELRKTHDKLTALYHPIECFPCNGYFCSDPKCIRSIPDEEIIKAVEGVI